MVAARFLPSDNIYSTPSFVVMCSKIIFIPGILFLIGSSISSMKNASLSKISTDGEEVSPCIHIGTPTSVIFSNNGGIRSLLHLIESWL